MSCGLRESSRVDYTEREERLREREKRKMFPITGPPQREEILREIKMKRFLNFYWSMPQWNFWEDNISFCSFWSCVPNFLSGRLHREKKDWEREKENVFPLHHRPYTERRSFVWERKMKRFLNFIKVCHNEFFERTT